MKYVQITTPDGSPKVFDNADLVPANDSEEGVNPEVRTVDFWEHIETPDVSLQWLAQKSKRPSHQIQLPYPLYNKQSIEELRGEVLTIKYVDGAYNYQFTGTILEQPSIENVNETSFQKVTATIIEANNDNVSITNLLKSSELTAPYITVNLNTSKGEVSQYVESDSISIQQGRNRWVFDTAGFEALEFDEVYNSYEGTMTGNNLNETYNVRIYTLKDRPILILTDDASFTTPLPPDNYQVSFNVTNATNFNFRTKLQPKRFTPDKVGETKLINGVNEDNYFITWSGYLVKLYLSEEEYSNLYNYINNAELSLIFQDGTTIKAENKILPEVQETSGIDIVSVELQIIYNKKTLSI